MKSEAVVPRHGTRCFVLHLERTCVTPDECNKRLQGAVQAVRMPRLPAVFSSLLLLTLLARPCRNILLAAKQLGLLRSGVSRITYLYLLSAKNCPKP